MLNLHHVFGEEINILSKKGEAIIYFIAMQVKRLLKMHSETKKKLVRGKRNVWSRVEANIIK